MYPYRFSIFTATKNRANLLNNLYNQIKSQTYDGPYEWVVVSDGSTDNTVEVMTNIKKESKIPIKLIINKRGGKHVAWRLATAVFEGRYVVSCDDDDPISSNTLAIFDNYWKKIEESLDYEKFWEVRARAKYEDGSLVGPELPLPYFDSDYNEVTFKLHKGCEMVGCRKVEVLRNEAAVPEQILFDDKISNYTEGLRWSKAARKFKTRFVPDVIRTYVVGHDSLCVTPKGFNRSTQKNYNSLVNSLYSLNELHDLMKKYDVKRYIVTMLLLAYSSIRIHEPILQYVNRKSDRLLVALFLPLAFVFYKIRRR